MADLLQAQATDWETELDEAITCPDCGGRLQRREWQTMKGGQLGTQFRCVACRIDLWSVDSNFEF